MGVGFCRGRSSAPEGGKVVLEEGTVEEGDAGARHLQGGLWGEPVGGELLDPSDERSGGKVGAVAGAGKSHEIKVSELPATRVDATLALG